MSGVAVEQRLSVLFVQLNASTSHVAGGNTKGTEETQREWWYVRGGFRLPP